MRKSAWILSFAMLVFCMGIGLLFPNILFSRSFDRTIGQIEEYDIEPVEIGQTNSIVDAMRCLFYRMYTFAYQEEMAGLTRKQVLDICNTFLEGLNAEEWGCAAFEVNGTNSVSDCELSVASIDDEQIDKRQQEKMYLYSADGETAVATTEREEKSGKEEIQQSESISAVLWTVTVELPDGVFVEMQVDDKSKKVVQITSCKTIEDYSVDYYGEIEHVEYVREVLIPFLEEYYDASLQNIKIDAEDFMITLTDGNNETAILNIHFSNGLINMSVFG